MYNYNDQAKEYEIDMTCSTNVEKSNSYRLLAGKAEGKTLRRKTGHRWADNMKMDLREIGCGDVDWIGLAQDRDQ
jgi:hypothetical protein